MRRARALTATAAAIGTLLALAPSGAAAEESLGLTQAGGARFPHRAFVLSLPSEVSLDESRVVVRENGERVSNVSLTPAGAAESGTLGVVLVLDASNSMKGSAIEGAMVAARAFAAQRAENQQVAIVAFNSASKVVLPFTTSGEAIDAALANPPALARGTHIYDAVETALALLERAKVAAGSVIVLSDGGDTGSRSSAAGVAAAARAAHVRVFAVGLDSDDFRPKALAGLATAADGEYSEAASSEDLERIFDGLGARLASEYLLRYRSGARPHESVQVSVTVEGVEGIGVARYTSPAFADDRSGPFHRSRAEILLRSTGGMLIVGVLAAAFIAIALVVVLRPAKRTLRKRMAEFVSVVSPEDKKRREEALETDAVLSAAERSFERLRWWARFKEDLEIARIRLSPVHIVLWTAIGTAFATWLLYLVGGSLIFAPFGFAVPFVVRSVIRRTLDRQRNLFADQLPDNLQVLSSALRAGHSLVGALSVVVDDCPDPSRAEFGRVVADEQLGVPLEEAFGVVARRMANRDLEQIALVAALQRRTGGNTAEVLDRVAETIRSRFELRRMVKTLTTQGRLSRWIVSLLPVGLLFLITLINPAYMKPLYTHPVGRALLVFAAVMVISGSLVIKKIVNIKV